MGILNSIFGRKQPAPAAVPEPVGETVLYNVYSTLVEIPAPQFPHLLHARRDLSDPDLLEHLNGFCSYIFGRGDGKMSQDKYHVILQVQRVQHHISMGVAAADKEAFQAWAMAANAIVFTPAGHVLDPQGRILVSGQNGTRAPDATLPHPDQALARKARTVALLEQRGITVPATLPPLVGESELVLRTNDEAVGRARALLMVALRADSVASGEPMSAELLMNKMPLADDYLSDQEREFLDQEAPSQNDCAQLIWRYESLYLLEWALGLVDELPFPDAPCDSASTAATLISMRGPQLRGASEILDALDLHYRLHWHVRQKRLKKQGEADGVDADVLIERHRALNWLVRFEHAPWDDVDTPT
ncbi:DUF4272 domain-containing protein [Massilia sp. PAMC28688]|uniref:DUF4272 domain-containing protein n=1 Tax=Massilia sp. PAMC28688 TaxID=2861283 RepID=UPI001C625EA0|nr:DUF4272 domain-containing protein [Massilia sp. PAMC28688]QYF94271.1 DUF4272 domain-containing protein [Massilia sp. PAMC28688]